MRKWTWVSTFQIAQGGGRCRFYKDGCTVQELDKEGQLFTAPVHGRCEPDAWHECDSGTDLQWGMIAECEGTGDFILGMRATERHEWLLAGAECSVGKAKGAVMVTTGAACSGEGLLSDMGLVSDDSGKLVSMIAGLKGSALRKHLEDGHRPYSDKCPWCVRANLRERRAERKLREAKFNPNGWVIDGDFSGRHEPDIDGRTWAYVGVEVETGYRFVGLQDDRSAANTLVSLKQFECELKKVSGNLEGRVMHDDDDDDKSFRGVVEEHATTQGWHDTNTGGYMPNANSVVERRIGMLNQVFRCVLLVATGGRIYYEQLWGPGLVHANSIVNDRPWPNRDSPTDVLSGKPAVKPRPKHVFGEYCIYKVRSAQKTGKWQPNNEMSIWLGHSEDVHGGHRVAPVEWNEANQCWDIRSTVVATTVRVYDNVFPLRMGPTDGRHIEQDFDSFVDQTFEPLLQGDGILKQVVADVESDSGYNSEGDQQYEVEKITDRKVVKGEFSYTVKWKGYINRHRVWRRESELKCDDLIAQYESERAEKAVRSMAKRRSDRLKGRSGHGLMAYMLSTAEISQGEGVLSLPDDDTALEVQYLHWKQGLDGDASELIQGYDKEMDQMLRRRLRFITDPTEGARVVKEHPKVPLRPRLELKKDGRRKMRLLLLGYREPDEWDIGPNASPVAKLSTIRSLVFKRGDLSEMLSMIDISYAFLQSENYSSDGPPRYVSMRAYKGAKKHLFQLLGPLYGQRSAPRARSFVVGGRVRSG